MPDRILNAFLQRQADEGLALSRESDLVHIVPMPAPVLSDRFLVHFACTGLVRNPGGSIAEAHEFAVGIHFPADFLRSANPFQVLTWLGPRHVFHPNIATHAPAICVGRLAPGTSLVDLVYQCWEIITWNKVTMREDDALNHDACQWARAHPDRIPVDTRPLKRQRPPVVLPSLVPGS